MSNYHNDIIYPSKQAYVGSTSISVLAICWKPMLEQCSSAHTSHRGDVGPTLEKKYIQHIVIVSMI